MFQKFLMRRSRLIAPSDHFRLARSCLDGGYVQKSWGYTVLFERRRKWPVKAASSPSRALILVSRVFLLWVLLVFRMSSKAPKFITFRVNFGRVGTTLEIGEINNSGVVCELNYNYSIVVLWKSLMFFSNFYFQFSAFPDYLMCHQRFQPNSMLLRRARWFKKVFFGSQIPASSENCRETFSSTLI